MKVKYNRTSTLRQEGNRFELDTAEYDLVLFDKGVSGSVPFVERPDGKRLMQMVGRGEVQTVVFEELSRAGRNTVDVLNTLQVMGDMNVNVVIRNLGVESRPNGQDENPVWTILVSVMAAIYDMERRSIRERTKMGRQIYLRNGGRLGRPRNSIESDHKFLSKPKSQEILKYLKKGKYSQREIAKLCRASPATVRKVRRMMGQSRTDLDS